MSTTPTPTRASGTEIEVETCEVCQDAGDLAPWPCCGEVSACAPCAEYNQTCESCQYLQDRSQSIATW